MSTFMRSLLLVLAAVFTLAGVAGCGDPEPIDPAEEFGDDPGAQDDGFDMGQEQPGMDPGDEPEMEWDDEGGDFDDFDDEY